MALSTEIAGFLLTQESDDDDDELLRPTSFSSSRASLVSSSSSPPHGSQTEEEAEDASAKASAPVAVTQEEGEATIAPSRVALLHAQARRNVLRGGAPVEKVTQTWQLGWDYMIKKQGGKTMQLQIFPCVLRPRQGPEAGALHRAPGSNEYVVQYLGLKGQYSTLTDAITKSRYVPAYFPTRPKKFKAWSEEDRSADLALDQTQWSQVLMSLYLKQLRRLPAFKSDQTDLLVLEEEIYLKDALDQVLKQEREAIEVARRQDEQKEQREAAAAAAAADAERDCENQEEEEKGEVGEPMEDVTSNGEGTSTDPSASASVSATAAAGTTETTSPHESVPDTAIVRQSCRIREKKSLQRKRPLANQQQSTRILQAGDEIRYPFMGDYRAGNIRVGRITQVFSERKDADIALKMDNGDFVSHGSLVKLERRWLRQKLVPQQASEFIGTEYFHLKTDRNGQFDHLHDERSDAVGAILRETTQHLREVGWRASQEIVTEEAGEGVDGDDACRGCGERDQGDDDEADEQRRAKKSRR